MNTATPPAKPYRLSIEQYDAMVDSGVFTSEDRFELIEGLLVAKTTKSPPGSVSAGLCKRILGHLVDDNGWHARTHQPVRIPSRSSEPEPDVSVARGTIRSYEKQHPNPEDIALVVEVSDSSLEQDRMLAETYGAGGIPVYWIIDIPARRLEVFSSPVDGVYSVHQILHETESVDLVIEGRMLGRISVAELLPRP
jgi:Uma2 family endonuclease